VSNASAPSPVISSLQGRLIVSCQAPSGSPMRKVDTIVALARCAEIGGAAAVRVDGATNIRAVREAVSLPIIGINKVRVGGVNLITPSLELLATLGAAGASIVAVELTRRAHASEALYRDVLAEVNAVAQVTTRR
jgi:N-acylglucosamine-6-phosphate 2-epimerase